MRHTLNITRWDPGGHKEMSSTFADQYSALVYESKCGGRRGSWKVSANEYSFAHRVDMEPK
jgi:hypothetical protein